MSSISSDHLNQTKVRLVEALGEKKHKYFHYMKQWFRMRASKEEFDTNARELLSHDLVHLHNEFLLALLTKCQLFSFPTATTPTKTEVLHRHDDLQRSSDIGLITGASITTTHSMPIINNHTPVPTIDRKKLKPKKKIKPTKPPTDSNFEPVSLQDIAPTPSLREPQAIMDAGPGYHSRSMHLLDTGPLRGRLLLAAWDYGLTNVSDTVASFLQEATKQCLKNILSAVVTQRRGYRVREGRFIHSLGTIPANPWLRNTASLNDWMSESLGLPFGEGSESGKRPVWPSVDLAEQNAAHLASCAPPYDTPLPAISCFDLFNTLKMKKSVLPCDSVYSLAMERISSQLWHPGWAELEQDMIAAQESAVRDSIREHRLATNAVF